MVVGNCSNTNEPARSLRGSIAGGAFVTFKATQNIPAPGGKMHADSFCSVGRLKNGTDWACTKLRLVAARNLIYPVAHENTRA